MIYNRSSFFFIGESWTLKVQGLTIMTCMNRWAPYGRQKRMYRNEGNKKKTSDSLFVTELQWNSDLK